MQLTGIHHLTAITAHAQRNHAFYTQTLGMRLVKKSVNQDDVSAYHLFYADGDASPGCDLTFFDWPAAAERRGTRSISRTGLRVGRAESLDWWEKRLAAAQVPAARPERDGRSVLDFDDFEGQRLSLSVDTTPAAREAKPWNQSPVPAEHQIVGLGPITISVPELAPTDRVLTGLMAMRPVREYAWGASRVKVYEMGPGGPGAELHVAVESGTPARQGAGGVHHVAFRVPDAEQYAAWERKLEAFGVHSSGPVDRYYFRSLYFREPNGVLFELATDGPGFAVDEPQDRLGEKLALPPFLEHRRAEIEANLKPL
ncbi:MAG TPA: ring-cleaving dioxygenase [Opitutaceae bacterium]|jgi:glyoxalase family protein